MRGDRWSRALWAGGGSSLFKNFQRVEPGGVPGLNALDKAGSLLRLVRHVTLFFRAFDVRYGRRDNIKTPHPGGWPGLTSNPSHQGANALGNWILVNGIIKTLKSSLYLSMNQPRSREVIPRISLDFRYTLISALAASEPYSR